MSPNVLPRLSELFKELNVEDESLVLPPLRMFTETCSRGPPLVPLDDALKYAPPNLPQIRRPLGPNSSNISHGSEEHYSRYSCSMTDRDTYSRDLSPSNENQDIDSETAYDHRPAQSLLFNSPQRKVKPALSGSSKPKKVKYHFCEICQKPFPRPSGLRAHMNMHTKEKPFECGFQGCQKRFSVSSNAKRHLRTHGVGLSPSDEPSDLPYVVDFEEPMVIGMSSDNAIRPLSSSEPINLRWMPPGAGSRRSQKTQIFTGTI